MNNISEEKRIDAPVAKRRVSPTRRYNHREGVYHWSRRSKLLLFSLGLALVVIFFLSLSLGIKVYTLGEENDDLRVKLRQSEEELQQLKPETIQLRKDVKELVAGRLPRLVPLVYDKVIPINQEYVKNIVFNRLVEDEIQNCEFKLIMENESLNGLWPEFGVYFFNGAGLQVAVANIGGDNDKGPDGDLLGPKEARSVSSKITFTEEDTPEYFMVRIKEEYDVAVEQEDVAVEQEDVAVEQEDVAVEQEDVAVEQEDVAVEQEEKE